MEIAMKKTDIVKLCADELRNHRQFEHDKLQSSHAHELIAAFFGYKSKNAMLADITHPISNLHHSDFVVLPPYNEEVDLLFRHRRKELGINLIDEIDVLHIVEPMLNERNITCYSQTLEDLAKIFAQRDLFKELKSFGIDYDQTNMNLEVSNPSKSDGKTTFIISVDYYSDLGEKIQNFNTMTVTFSCIAGQVGYKNPTILKEKNAQQPHLLQTQNARSEWPYPAGTLVMLRPDNCIGIVLKSEDGGMYGGGGKVITDKDLGASFVKGQVFPLADQSIDFMPLRLVMPYGKYICSDGSEVLYNRDYRPLWKKEPDGAVVPVDSDQYIDHVRQEGFFGTSNNALAWGDPDVIRKIGTKILKEWGVEHKRPQILELLSIAICNGDAEILRPKIKILGAFV